LFESKSVFRKPIVVLRLFVRSRKQGSYIASVPLKRLLELSGCSFRQWSVEKADNGWWLILEAI
jgi:hypothetical protein